MVRMYKFGKLSKGSSAPITITSSNLGEFVPLISTTLGSVVLDVLVPKMRMLLPGDTARVLMDSKLFGHFRILSRSQQE